MTLKRIFLFIGSLCLGALLSISGISLYWWLQSDPILQMSAVGIVRQREGESIAVSIPVKLYQDIDDYTFYTKTVDAYGRVINTTASSEVDPEFVGQYKMITSSMLKPGVFDLIIVMEYRLNPLAMRSQEFTFALLIVDKIGFEHDNRSTTKEIRTESGSK